MKIELVMVGKTHDKCFVKGIEDYCQRICHYLPFSIQVIPELKNTKALSESQQKEMEGNLIIKKLEGADYIVLLDEHGKQFRSIEFAQWIEKKQQNVRKMAFVIGGPYGFSEKVYQIAHDKISLSAMTFSHQMIRLIFTEQLYRACTIIKGEPYHHE